MRRTLTLLLFATTLGGCTSGVGRPVHEVTARMGRDSAQHVTVTAHTYYFEPARIVVKRDVPVELTVHNGAWFVPHDFSCDAADAGIHVDAPLGMFHGTKHVKFTPTKTGEYEFHCDVDHHAMKGMTGKIVVTD